MITSRKLDTEKLIDGKSIPNELLAMIFKVVHKKLVVKL